MVEARNFVLRFVISISHDECLVFWPPIGNQAAQNLSKSDDSSSLALEVELLLGEVVTAEGVGERQESDDE